MFETIDSIPWRELKHAYGPAGDTPGWIRKLASSKSTTRERALDKLIFSIFHEGTIYSASVAAIPLLEIVASPEAGDRTPALQLLQALSTGASYHEACAGTCFNKEKSQTPQWAEQVREEKQWVAQIHERLLAGVPEIIRVLQGGRGKEPVAAASLLGTLSEDAGAREALVRATGEANPELTAGALQAIGAEDDAPVEVLEECFARASNELVRTVAALQVLYHRDRSAPPAAIAHLMEQLRVPQAEVRKTYETLPDAGSFLGDLGKALAGAPMPVIEEAFPLLYTQVKKSPHPLNHNETFGLLLLAIKLAPPVDGKWVREKLTQPQRMAIRLVADRAWSNWKGRRSMFGNMVDQLQALGLPGKREDIFALLAGTPEGVQTAEEEAFWTARRKRPWWKIW